MACKCYLTGKYCKDPEGLLCPKHKNSNYQIEQDYYYISDTCRYYGLKRAEEMKKIFKEDF